MDHISEVREQDLKILHEKRALEKICGPIPQGQWEQRPVGESSVLKALKSDLESREAKGIQTYGTTLDTCNLSCKQVLQHAYEEALDHAMYLKKLIQMEDE